MQSLSLSNLSISSTAQNSFNYPISQDPHMQLPIKSEKSTPQRFKLSSLLRSFFRSNTNANIELIELEERMIISEKREEVLSNFFTFEVQIEVLQLFYTFQNSGKVTSFLDVNKFLVPLLLTAPFHVRKYFPDAKLLLEVEVDPEEDYQELAVCIVTNMSVDEAFQKMERFDHIWWLGASDKAQLKLAFHVEFE